VQRSRRSLCDVTATDSERGALGQRDDPDVCLETRDLLHGRGGLHFSQKLVDAGDTFCGVVAFECHVGPCLSGEGASVGSSVAARLFGFELYLVKAHL